MIGFSPDGRETLHEALDEIEIEARTLSETELLWRVASLLTTLSPDEAVAELSTSFRPLIESFVSPTHRRSEPPSMIAPDARPLQFSLSEEPEVRLMFSPTQSCTGNQGFVSGSLNHADDEKPLLIIADPTRSPRCINVDAREGIVDATIPVIGTRKNADVLTQDDFTHMGTVTINGRCFAPSRHHAIEEDVPQLQLADINIDVGTPTQFQRMRGDSFRRSFMTSGIFAPPSATYRDCVEHGEGGQCTNSGASCEWGAKCTTLRLVVTTICVCMIRP